MLFTNRGVGCFRYALSLNGRSYVLEEFFGIIRYYCVCHCLPVTIVPFIMCPMSVPLLSRCCTTTPLLSRVCPVIVPRNPSPVERRRKANKKFGPGVGSGKSQTRPWLVNDETGHCCD